MEGAIKNEQDLFEDPIIEKVPYKLVCPQPLHPLAQRSEVVEDFFINTNGAFLLRGNSDGKYFINLQFNNLVDCSLPPAPIYQLALVVTCITCSQYEINRSKILTYCPRMEISLRLKSFKKNSRFIGKTVIINLKNSTTNCTSSIMVYVWCVKLICCCLNNIMLSRRRYC